MYDLAVLGGGSGGLSVAAAAARIGARVALIEKEHLGGECTYSGAVPSKALVQAARIAHLVRTSDRFGVKTPPAEIDFAAVMKRVRAVVAEFARGDSGDSLRAEGIDVYRGQPAFASYDTVLVDSRTAVEAQRFVIATGSRPAVPAIPGLADVGYLTSQSIWELEERPESLVILGAGPICVEFAQTFARLGTRVKLIAEPAHILPDEDPEVSETLETVLGADGIVIKTGVEITRVSSRNGQKVLQFRERASNDAFEAAGSDIFVGTGRRPNIEGLNLDAVHVHADPEHGIAVDEYLQTSANRIYAVGDVLQRHESSHSAEREAAVAVQNAVLRIPKKIDYSALPRVAFLDPEVASCGAKEAVARESHGDVCVFRTLCSDLDRARIDGCTEGFAKVIATNAGKILGASIVGDNASLVLQEFVLAMEHGLTLADLARTSHAYPTHAGLVRNLASQFNASPLDGGIMQSAVKWFLGYRSKRGSGSEKSAVASSESPTPEH